MTFEPTIAGPITFTTTEECGCTMIFSGSSARIVYCDMHKAAPELVAALEKAAEDLDTTADYVAATGQTGTADGIRSDARAARAALARANA